MKIYAYNRVNALRIVTILVAIVIITLIAIFAKNDSDAKGLAELEDRLKHHGVPVKELVVNPNRPDKIEISLQSSSVNDKLTFDDNWSMILARHEATFAYKYSDRISSYRLIIYNINAIPSPITG